MYPASPADVEIRLINADGSESRDFRQWHALRGGVCLRGAENREDYESKPGPA
jgi:hypothetical protein